MKPAVRRGACFTAILLISTQFLSACATAPPLMLGGDKSKDAPQGPRVAALVANLKCELADAANSQQELPYYTDIPSLQPRNHEASGPREFTLQNIFKEIEYVGEATFTLDVTQTGGFNPSFSIAKYYSPAVGDLLATGAILSVAGNLSEAAHRNLIFNSSVDFSRLVATETPLFPGILQPVQPILKRERDPCIAGTELGGDLRLKEILATGLIAAAMSNVSALQGAALPATAQGAIPTPVTIPTTFSYGQISTQVDFTINEGVNGGPNWMLKYVTTPGGGGNGGFLSYQRKVVDTLVVTFVPVCVRQKYWTDSSGPPYKYSPVLVEGTPAWANLLPPCGSINLFQAQANATAQAQSRNDEVLFLTRQLGP